jgi:chromosome partitioning protein
MKIICLASQKGGVAKTTSTHALGSLLAERGRSVLLVDLDPQSSLTNAAGIDDAADHSMAEVLIEGSALAGIIQTVAPGLDIAPSDIRLAEAELQLVGKIGREVVLKDALGPLRGRYDYVLIDCPPSLGLLTVNAMTAASDLLIPARAEYLSLRALVLLLSTINEVRAKLNRDLNIIGILVTFHDTRVLHHAEVLEAWRLAELPVLSMMVRRTVRAAEAPAFKQAINEYDPTSPATAAYRELAELIDG